MKGVYITILVMTPKIVLATVFLASSACFAAQPWSAFGPYYTGMSKSQAQKAGLANCVSKDTFTVTCEALKPIELAGSSSYESRLNFDAKTGVLKAINFRFPVSSEEELLAYMDRRYGEGMWGNVHTCRNRSWDKEEDSVVSYAACKKESRYLKASGFGIYISSIYTKGRAAQIRKRVELEKRQKDAIEKKARSFETR